MARHPIVLAAVIGVVLVTLGLVLTNTLMDFGDSAGLSGHGLVAMILGAFGMLALAILLMGLVFYSSRSGHDRAAHEQQAAIATSQEAQDLNTDGPKR